jgi:hypothetical protein
VKRISLFIAGALACVMVASVGTASAETVTPHIRRTCHDEVSNIRGGGARISVQASRVSSSQASYATCNKADAVFTAATAQELETPELVEGFHCVPSVLYQDRDVVEYDCHFQSADTSTHIVIGFKVTYL